MAYPTTIPGHSGFVQAGHGRRNSDGKRVVTKDVFQGTSRFRRSTSGGQDIQNDEAALSRGKNPQRSVKKETNPFAARPPRTMADQAEGPSAFSEFSSPRKPASAGFDNPRTKALLRR